MKDKRLIIIFLTVFLDLVGFGIIIPLNPYLAEAFGATPLQVGLLMSVYSLMQFVFSPLWGQLSDRIGRRPVILWSLMGAAVAHTSFAFATTFWGLVIARAFAGMFGGNLSAAMAYIADITPDKDRSKGMGMIGAAFGLGFILGPTIGGLSANLGHQLGSVPPLGASFPAIVAGSICFLNAVFAYFKLPESRVGDSSRIHGSRFQRILKALGTPVLNGLMLMLFLNTLAMATIEASLFLYVQQTFQWSLMQASFGFAYIGIIMVITQGYLIRKLMPKFGEREVLTWGLVLSALGFGLCSAGTTVGILAVGVTLLGFGNGMANPALNGSISLVSGQDVQGNNMGVSQSLSSLARILGPAIGGAFYQGIGWWSPFVTASLLIACSFGLAAFLRPRLPQSGRVY